MSVDIWKSMVKVNLKKWLKSIGIGFGIAALRCNNSFFLSRFSYRFNNKIVYFFNQGPIVALTVRKLFQYWLPTVFLVYYRPWSYFHRKHRFDFLFLFFGPVNLLPPLCTKQRSILNMYGIVEIQFQYVLADSQSCIILLYNYTLGFVAIYKHLPIIMYIYLPCSQRAARYGHLRHVASTVLLDVANENGCIHGIVIHGIVDNILKNSRSYK